MAAAVSCVVASVTSARGSSRARMMNSLGAPNVVISGAVMPAASSVDRSRAVLISSDLAVSSIRVPPVNSMLWLTPRMASNNSPGIMNSSAKLSAGLRMLRKS